MYHILQNDGCETGQYVLPDKLGKYFDVRHPCCVGSITKNYLCITHTVEHNYISPSSTVA
jgi:hypothetical protein